ncbi:MAG: hypothetical protein HRT74_00560, partial [Flavobacteriales bacterium]|nr:hypothetical protein [Flavobacteriales bacterium]
MEFKLSSKVKRNCFITMGLGVVLMIIGLLTGDHMTGQRFWADFLVTGFFFFAIALGALFFYALQYAAEVGWSAQLKRIYEAMFSYLPIGSICILIVLVAGIAHQHHLYHWMDSSLYFEYVVDQDGVETFTNEYQAGAVENPNFDKIINDKQAYLNTPFWSFRSIV